jgi:hypothetical protein
VALEVGSEGVEGSAGDVALPNRSTFWPAVVKSGLRLGCRLEKSWLITYAVETYGVEEGEGRRLCMVRPRRERMIRVDCASSRISTPVRLGRPLRATADRAISVILTVLNLGPPVTGSRRLARSSFMPSSDVSTSRCPDLASSLESWRHGADRDRGLRWSGHQAAAARP